MSKEYPAFIEDTKDDVYTCLVLVGAVELRLQFSEEVMKHYDFKKWDRFYWMPSEDGSLSTKNIRPGKRAEDLLKEEWIWKSMTD